MNGIRLGAVNRNAAFRLYTNVRFLVIGCAVLTLIGSNTARSQTAAQTYSPTYPAAQQTVGQTATKQEIARLEINVVRAGQSLPITQVPRVQKGDVLKVRLLDEAVSGVKIDQTQWDWTLVVAYANPLINQAKQETAAQEVRFRKTGWYREYSFTVPFDSQPIFFLAPRANYRGQIVKAMSKNFGELQKIGEKMVEISGAYAQISTFLNELQTVINQNQYGSGYSSPYGYSQNGQYPTGYNNNSTANNGYNYSNPYTYNPYSPQYSSNPQSSYWLNQAVERLAKSFNIQMPDCWRSNGYTNYPYSNYTNPYNSAYPSSYGSSGSYGSTYPGSGGFNSQDFIARSQCVAKTVRLEDFDVSITRMWQQGGVFFAAELQKKYPQLAYYISIAAAAIDFIVKVFQKSPLRIVPTMLASGDSQTSFANQSGVSANAYNSYPTSGSSAAYQPKMNSAPVAQSPPETARISVFSSQQPSDQEFLTAYPIVVQKWQAEADAKVIALDSPSLSESCLHAGVNVLKNTNLTNEWAADTYARDFKLLLSAGNGYRKEFSLRKNIGLGGWELALTTQDMAEIPKTKMQIAGIVTGVRGFNLLNSPQFPVSVANGGKWELAPEARSLFSIGGRRRIVLRNSTGDCRCLESVTYKPSFGGQFTFNRDAGENGLQVSPDGREAWFEIETTNFQPGAGALEIKNFSAEISSVDLKLYPAAPVITDLSVSRGDRQIAIRGDRIDQLQFVIANGFRATIQPAVSSTDIKNPNGSAKIAVFDDPQAKITAGSVRLELGLEDGRKFAYPQNFAVLPARPAISADQTGEIEAFSDASLTTKTKADATLNSLSIAEQLEAAKARVFPIESRQISVKLQNNVNDYEFKNESLRIETRIEKSLDPIGDFLKTEFEVLDSRSIRLNFYLYGDIHTRLGGRRIQFRIRDRERGDSDWYTVKQTFVRTPKVTSVNCTDQMSGMCEIKGAGLDYIAQISTDGGNSWYSLENGGTTVQSIANGLSVAGIPYLSNKKLLRIRLRDFPKSDGFYLPSYSYVNIVRVAFNKADLLKKKKPVSIMEPSQLSSTPTEKQIQQPEGTKAPPEIIQPITKSRRRVNAEPIEPLSNSSKLPKP